MERLDQHLEDRSGDLREIGSAGSSTACTSLRDMSRSFGHHDPELGQMPAQGIDDLGPLPHQEIARPEHESGGLGLLALGRHEAHGRALGRLADRLGIAASFFCRLTNGSHEESMCKGSHAVMGDLLACSRSQVRAR